MRIGITCYPTYGGSGAVATELGLALAKRGHEVHFISYASPFRLRGYTERVTFHEVVPTDYPLFEHSPYAFALAVKQHEVALRENLQIMHVHYAIPHAATAWLAKQMLEDEGRQMQLLTTLHGTDITLVGRDPSFFSLTRFSIEKSDRVTAVSEFLRQETYRAFGCVNCQVDVIPNFINPAEYHPADEGQLRTSIAPAGHRILIHVSNFRPVKRVPDVVRVFAGVRKTVPATLVLVGDGPDRDIVQDEAQRLGVKRDVRFFGRVDDVADILREADLFLLPSETESFGLAALEAMACGVPVVAAKVGGLPEVVVEGETGFLTPLGDVAAMTERSLQLLTDTALHLRFRRQAVQRALDFSTDRIVPRYEAVYEELVGGGG